ncbi:MAG: hypothetical protein R3F37_15805 [Candidatus Competibacteraceae bacterium]
MKKIMLIVLALLGLVIVYLLAWPVPIEPQAWQAPPNPGYTGIFAPNERLRAIEQLPLGDQYGPEEVIVDRQGELYAATHDGWIVRMAADGSAAQNWVQTNGRPLGLAFDPQGNLIVADAFRGLLQITPAGAVTELATEADGIPIRYANNVDVAADGRIYFSTHRPASPPVLPAAPMPPACWILWNTAAAVGCWFTIRQRNAHRPCWMD